jgi:predicted HicB family RNase H-like nuclease
MKNLLEYKGFTAKIEFDPRDEIFFGKLIEIDDEVTFHGETVAELKQNFHETVDFHIEVCKKLNKPVKKQFSGKVMLRVAPEIHANFAKQAVAKKQSLNQWATNILLKECQN